MTQAIIDTNLLRPHSSREASSSAAEKRHLSIDDIMKRAGWVSCSTFERFYVKLFMAAFT